VHQDIEFGLPLHHRESSAVTLHRSRRSLRFIWLAIGVYLTSGCDTREAVGPSELPSEPASAPSFAFALAGYFPPSEANGGWRRTTSTDNIRALGMKPEGLSALGAYGMSLPWENFSTGVSGYDPSNKAALVIKGGWIVGEYYNKSSARTAVYYLASNGKSFAMMLMGRLQLDYPALGITASSRLYDRRWLAQGFPLTDSRKADITFDHLFRHASGIIPQVQDPIADGSLSSKPGWNFAPFTVGKDADYPVSAPLYFRPGYPSTYPKGDTYSSVAFNHLSLVFRNVSGMEAGVYLRNRILNPIGVGRMAFITNSGMGSYVWATGGNQLASARDYARLAYLLLHEGTWAGRQIFTSSWIRRFTTASGYRNMDSNANCHWGKQYPKDMYRLIGSGINIAFIVPSLDLVATLTGRIPNTMRDQVSNTFLQKLFASVTQRYVTCDGRIINGSPTSQKVTALTLIDSNTDQPILTLTNGMTITLANLATRNLNIRAVTSPSTVGSVRFGLDGNSNYRTETASPYALAGDDAGNYRAWTPALGAHTLKATPYTGSSGTGTAGTSLTVGFTVK
jgi:CubicO group peptidase (beta-lactamase class C family)